MRGNDVRVTKDKNKIKLNRYEQEQNFNLLIIKAFCVTLVVLNFILSIYEPYSLAFDNILVWINCMVIVHMCMKATGWSVLFIGNSVNILPWCLVLCIQLLATLLFGFGEINWIRFGIVKGLEIIYMVFLAIDSLHYEFEVEIEEN